jgi:hypothetical protein
MQTFALLVIASVAVGTTIVAAFQHIRAEREADRKAAEEEKRKLLAAIAILELKRKLAAYEAVYAQIVQQPGGHQVIVALKRQILEIERHT